MKNIIAFGLMFFSFAQLANSQAPNWKWGKSAGGAGNDLGYSIKTDISGNSYVTGRFNATATFGSLFSSSYGGPDIFIAKYDVTGNCVWVNHAGSTNVGDVYGDEARGISTDAFGNIYVTGNFHDSARFDGIKLPGNGYREIFVAKYDNNGNAIWAKQPTGNISNNYSRAIAVDGNGNSYITGYLGGGTNTFGTFSTNGPGGYVVKYDSAGTVVYAIKLGTNGAIDLYSIAVDSSGSAYVTGYLQSSEIVNGKTYTSIGGRDAVIIKVNPNGSFSWLKQAGGINAYVYGTGITADNRNRIYLTGYYDISIHFDTITFPTPTSGSNELFVAKYDSSGSVLWAKHSVSSDEIEALAIASDKNSNVYITGERRGNSVFGTCSLPGSSSHTFITKIDSTGNCSYSATSVYGNPGAFGQGISVSNQGGISECIYLNITGFSKAPIVFGKDTTIFYGGEDLFVASYQYTPDSLCTQGILPHADFISSDTIFCSESGNCIDFTDHSTNNPTSWKWSFPGALPDTSTQQNPTNICYSTPGTYAVKLVVSNSNGSDSLTVSPMITFATSAAPPVLIFSGDTLYCSHASAYQWYFNGSQILNATDSFYVTTSDGLYSVQITDNNGCTRLSNGFTVSVNEVSGLGGIKVYPNPAKDQFTVYGSRFTASSTIDIYNIVGMNVYSGLLNSKQETVNPPKDGSAVVDCKQFFPGVYIVELGNGDKVYRAKFVKE